MFKYCLNGINKKCFPIFNRVFKFENIIHFNSFKITKSFSDKIDNNEEEPNYQLREIQMNPRYEAAVSFFVAGDYDKAIKSLMELKRKIKEDNSEISEDYLFLLKKLITFHKVNKDLKSSIEILKEIKTISLRLYKSDFNYLFENLEYVIINLTNFNPTESIEFINEVLEEQFLPNFFDHIFKYYLGSAYVLEGKHLDKAIETFNSIENELDDNYIKACVYNNKACAIWWYTMNKYITQMKHKQGMSFDLVQSLSKEMFEVVKIYKNAIISIENLENFKYEDKYTFQSNLPKEEQRENFLKFITSINFDLSIKIDPIFLKEFGASKDSLTNIKTSAIIFSNLGELYYSIKDYKKSLIALNSANLFFQNFSKNDPLFFKNLSLVAMNNWKLTNKPEAPKEMFEKILSNLKQFGNNYEKVFIFRTYGEMLIEENQQSVLGNSLMEEAQKIEEKIPYYECRKIYLTLPQES